MKIITTSGKEKTEHNLESGPGNLTVLVHQQGIRVDVPDAVEITSFKTIDTINKLNQVQWDWIRTGEVFQLLFHIAFDGCEIEIPEDIEDLKAGDVGVAHIAGLIILGIEAVFEKKNVFFRTPEDHLHPKVQLNLADVVRVMLRLSGGGGVVKVAGENDPKESDLFTKFLDERIETAGKKIKKNEKTDREMTLDWLEAHAKIRGTDRKFAKLPKYDVEYTIGELIEHVKNDNEVGKQMVQLYLSYQNKE